MERTRNGGTVILAGPDGTGKSSVVTRSRKAFPDQPLTYLWQRPAILPRRSPEGTGDATRPHAASPYGRGISWLKLVYVWLDYQLGWWLRIRPYARRGGITMIDRGWWDMAVDPKRYRLKIPPRAIEILGRAIPAPELLVVLHAPPEVILERKGDLSAEEIERQLDRWRQVLPKRVPVVWVDAARPLDEVSGSVAEAMRDRGVGK